MSSVSGGVGEESAEAAGVLANACITKQMLEDPDHLPRLKTSQFTNGLVVELRKLEGASSNRLATLLKQLAPSELQDKIESCNTNSLRNRADNVWNNYQKQSRNVKKDRRQALEDFLKKEFSLPVPRQTPAHDEASSSTHFKLEQVRKEKKACKRQITQLEREREDIEEKYERLIQDYYTTVSQLQTNEANFRQVMQEKSELSEELSSFDKANSTLMAKLDSLEAKLSRSTARSKSKTDLVRNVNKKLKRRDETIEEKEEEIRDKDTTIKELEAAVASTSNQALEEVQLFTLKKKVKSMHDSKRWLEKKLEKEQADKTQVQKDLEDTVDILHEKIKDLQNENTQLQQIQALMESDQVTTFQDGKYCDEIREVVMDLLTSGVSMNKVPGVITTVLSKLAGKTVERLPSKGLMSRLLVEAKILASRQVGEAIIAGAAEMEKGNCLHQDGTSKFFRKFQAFDVTLPSGKTLVMSMSEIPTGDAEGILSAFSESCRDLAEVLCNPGEDVAKRTAQIITSFTSTMSDQGATNPLFNKQLEEMRRELLPVVEDKWESLTDEVKDELSNMCNHFCRMHLLVNFATEANSTLKIFEDAISQGKNPLAFSQQGESGAARLIRTACTAFTDKGSEKSGAPHYFQTHMAHHYHEEENHMVTFRGNRFNILFYNGAAVYHHHKQIISFVSSWPDPNGLLKAVKADATQKVYVAGVRALGIVDKTVTGPFFRLLGLEKGVLDLNMHLHQMQLSLERWSQDGSTLLAGEPLFDEKVVPRHKDAMFESLFSSPEDDELDILTQQALEVVCAALLILLERQAYQQLPGGKFWEPTEEVRKKSGHVPTTNVVSERDFAVLDNLLRAKPYGSSLAFEAYLMWMNNETNVWLQSLSPDDKEKHMEYARTHAGKVYARFQEKKEKIKEKRLATLLQRQKEKDEKMKRMRQKKMVLTEEVVKLGGLWRTPEEVDEKVKAISKPNALEAVKIQLQFHKKVLRSEGMKEHFQMTVTRPGKKKHTFNIEEKVEHLKEVLKNNNVSEDTHVESDSDEEDDTEYVTLKEQDELTTNVEGLKTRLSEKREVAREKRDVNKQKSSLPEYLKDPSKLVGQCVKHKCFTQNSSGQEEAKWFLGKVTRIVSRSEEAIKTVYHIEYDDENEDDEEFNLLQDMQKGDLIVLS